MKLAQECIHSIQEYCSVLYGTAGLAILQEGAAAPTEPAAIVQEALHFAEWPLRAKSPEVRRSKDLIDLRKQPGSRVLPMDEPRELEAPLLVPLLLV